MSAPEVKGWCPGALRPMLSGDGLVVRIRARGGRLEPETLREIAALSRRFGNGHIDLSSRANLQLRGISAATHAPLIDGLRALGLIDRSAESEAHRNVIVTPFWAEGDGTADLAARLEEAVSAPEAPRMPGKFGYAVDTGPVRVLAGDPADIRIERGASGDLIVRADGAETGALSSLQDAVGAAVDLARWFLATGGAPAGRGRMAAHLARGACLPSAFRARTPCAAAPATRPGPHPLGFVAGFSFGQLSAETLAALAALGPLRLTPWRMVLIEGATAAPAIAGLITDSADPLLSVTACTGAPDCPQAHIATRPLAQRLAAGLPSGARLHVSGCAKGCAHPRAASFTFVGRAGGLCDLVLDGTTTDTPVRTGLDPARPEPDLLTKADHAP